MNAKLGFNLCLVDDQVKEFKALLELQFPGGAPDEIVEDALTDIVFTDFVSTPLADGAYECIQTVRLGVRFENVMAALRAGKFGNLHEAPLG